MTVFGLLFHRPLPNLKMIPIHYDYNQIPTTLQAGAVAVGNFDGIHRGHAQLIGQLIQLVRSIDGPAVVMTFDPPPMSVLYPERPTLPPITPLARRAELLAELGVDGLIVLPTNPELLNLSADQFFQQILVNKLRLRGMVEGPNFRFGKNRGGDIQVLEQLCRQYTVQLQIAQAANDSSEMISSTRIRALLSEGDVATANKLPTRPFRLSGIVSRGAGRGNRLLFPTANLTQIQSLVPAHGVYATRVHYGGQQYQAAMNIGPNLTFGEQSSKIEVHLLQFDGDLYDQPLHCDLMARIREVRKFNSKDELRQQIQLDLEHAAQTTPLS
jgi:riboflavin kinase/FMN adenylyltransferase